MTNFVTVCNKTQHVSVNKMKLTFVELLLILIQNRIDNYSKFAKMNFKQPGPWRWGGGLL